MSTISYIDRLILFEAIRTDEIACKVAGFSNEGCADLCDSSCAELKHETVTPEITETQIRDAYYSIGRILQNNIGHGEISGNYLQDHFCRIIAAEENSFTLMAEHGAFKDLKPGMDANEIKDALNPESLQLLMLAAREIKHIWPIYRFDFDSITDTADGRNIAALSVCGEPSHLESVHEAMIQSKNTDGAIMLAHYYQRYGSGIFGVSPTLNAEPSGLVPVLHMDPVTMDDIVGQESQKNTLKANLSILLSGLGANNMLLYGDSGTGKSSSVKALLNMYAGDGLKLISITKDRLHLLPDVFKQITDRGMKFIIFIDDLSFEENEREYKVFKSIVEGRIAPRPKNAIFIVTTNRKNIVKDTWSDRDGQDDVRPRDNMEEKRSLSDRFGITLVYSSPDKQEYLAIVRGIADKAGLSMSDDELVDEALKWEIRHGGRSGRAARQFVDYMIGIKTIGAGDFAETR